MKHGGYMFHEIPNEKRPLKIREERLHLTFWTPKSVKTIFQKCGKLKLIKIETYSSFNKIDKTGKGKWIRVLFQKIVPRKGKD